jgi:hypothetical protein
MRCSLAMGLRRHPHQEGEDQVEPQVGEELCPRRPGLMDEPDAAVGFFPCIGRRRLFQIHGRACARADQLEWIAHCWVGELVLNYRGHRTASVRVVPSSRLPLLCYTGLSTPATPRAPSRVSIASATTRPRLLHLLPIARRARRRR